MRKADQIPDKFKNLQRKDVPSIENIMMAQAIVWSKMSKDPSTQVGAAIFSTENRILSAGYNGTPVGWDDKDFPWGKNYEGDDKVFEKYPYVVHAEDNALRNFKKYNTNDAALEGSTIYVTLFPCLNCAKMIVEAGIKKVVYLTDIYANSLDVKSSKQYLRFNEVEFEQFESKDVQSMLLQLNADNESTINWNGGINRTRK